MALPAFLVKRVTPALEARELLVTLEPSPQMTAATVNSVCLGMSVMQRPGTKRPVPRGTITAGTLPSVKSVP